jgi:putative ABC transport system permease protein
VNAGGLMVWRVGVAEALAALRWHPLRALLAALAMAAAVATTALVRTGLDALAQSARDASARAFGSDSFVILNVSTQDASRRELADKLARNPNITRADVRFLDRVSDGQVRYAATVQRQGDVVAGGRTFENAAINGTQASLFDIRDVGLERGRVFTREEDVAGAPVVVAGDAVVQTLFPGVDPLGRAVRLGGRRFVVVGVLARQGTGAGVSLDRYVWMPIGAFERAFGATPSVQVFAKPADLRQLQPGEDRARVSMRARRHLGPSKTDTFDIVTPEASRSFVSAITERVGAAALPISLMALVAAMLVVANTTLVSVTQRTREIGVRRAMGARRVHVLAETLAESVLVALVGGAIGLFVAALALRAASGPVGLPLHLDVSTTLGSLGAAALAGLVSGWYPARRAAALDVVDAMRQE